MENDIVEDEELCDLALCRKRYHKGDQQGSDGKQRHQVLVFQLQLTKHFTLPFLILRSSTASSVNYVGHEEVCQRRSRKQAKNQKLMCAWWQILRL